MEFLGILLFFILFGIIVDTAKAVISVIKALFGKSDNNNLDEKSLVGKIATPLDKQENNKSSKTGKIGVTAKLNNTQLAKSEYHTCISNMSDIEIKDIDDWSEYVENIPNVEFKDVDDWNE